MNLTAASGSEYADMMAAMIRRGPKLSFVDTSWLGKERLPWTDISDQRYIFDDLGRGKRSTIL